MGATGVCPESGWIRHSFPVSRGREQSHWKSLTCEVGSRRLQTRLEGKKTGIRGEKLGGVGDSAGKARQRNC